MILTLKDQRKQMRIVQSNDAVCHKIGELALENSGLLAVCRQISMVNEPAWPAQPHLTANY
ncbi:MAG: hypothetical protein ACLVHV_13805 [Oscillospiraceae bacterium]